MNTKDKKESKKKKISLFEWFSSANGKDKKGTQIVIIIIVCCLLLFYYILHVDALKREDPWISSLEAWNQGFAHITRSPLDILPIRSSSITTFFSILLCLSLGGFLYYNNQKMRKHYNSETALGDATLMETNELEEFHKELTDPFGEPYAEGQNNTIWSEDIQLSLNTKKTGLTVNALVIGGTGTGKSYRIIGPNTLQRHSSYLITDPSGDLYAQYAPYLEYYGYRIKVLNLDHMEQSNHYNPFRYIHSDKDIEILVTMLISNTTNPDAKGEKFWEDCERALLCATISYLWHYEPKERQTFQRVLRMIRKADVSENDEDKISDMDRMMNNVRTEHPEDTFTTSQYDTFKLGAGKTLKSILISCAVRLQAFDLADVQTLTNTDDINLENIADEKTAVFIIIPTGESTFNYIGGMLYSQLFHALYRYAENTAKYGILCMDQDGEVFKTIRAANLQEKEAAKEKAKLYLESLKTAKVIENEKFKRTVGEKSISWYEIRSEDQKVMFGHRGSKEEAEAALKKMQKGYIIENASQSNEGRRCPIHVRMLLDEFKNTGKIPDFELRIATIRKYEISTLIILQSIAQIKQLYNDNWETITANCDVIEYIGGGIDQTTQKWLSDALGKETRVIQNMSFSKTGGSTSNNLQGVELFSVSKLRTMPKGTGLVIVRGKNALHGNLYDTVKHPMWDIKNSFPAEEYNPAKQAYLCNIYEDDFLHNERLEKEKEEKNKEVLMAPKTVDEEALDTSREKEQKEKEYNREDERIESTSILGTEIMTHSVEDILNAFRINSEAGCDELLDAMFLEDPDQSFEFSSKAPSY